MSATDESISGRSPKLLYKQKVMNKECFSSIKKGTLYHAGAVTSDVLNPVKFDRQIRLFLTSFFT
jgi:hypothetical protein